jgi:hypothetical protein
MIVTKEVYPPTPESEEAEEAFAPYESGEGPYIFCWGCHGFIIGPPGRRLCSCHNPAPLPPALAEKALALDGMRDALAEAYRRRWFRLLLHVLGDAEETEARAAWEALWPVARERATRKLAERGLNL